MEENRDVADAVTGCERLTLQIYYIVVTNQPGSIIQVSP
jgi:hypothetical protein